MSYGLQTIHYPYLQKPLYQGILPSGLTVFLLEKSGFEETCAALMVEVGGKDGFTENFPAGLAHFLEHSLFSLPDGQDAMQVFSELGATSNAYTSLYQTTYFFSTSQSASQPLELLRSMVAGFHVSQGGIAKEKDIILQEIKMYRDNPDDQLYTGILASLYPDTGLAVDIAGRESDIYKIDSFSLQDFHSRYYPQTNQVLFLTGNIDVDLIWKELLTSDSKMEKSVNCLSRKEVALHPILPHRKLTMEVASPKLALGIRGQEILSRQEVLTYRLSLSLFFSMLLGWTSETYQALYTAGKIDSSFTIHLEVRPDYHFLVLTVDTEEPIAVSTYLQKRLKFPFEQADFNEEHLSLLKREMYGDFIRGLNHVEGLTSQFMSDYTVHHTTFDIPALLQEIGLREVLAAGERFLANCDMTDFIIFPK